MVNQRFTLACRNYDGTNAIHRGLIKIPRVDLQIIEMSNLADMFGSMFRGKLDISEMSLAELIYYTSRNKCDFIGIPVFPSRVFRHGFIFCNRTSNIVVPEDLNGKKIGFMRWVQTAAIWIRGMLVDEYRVTPGKKHWYVASMHHWDEGHEGDEVRPRDGSVIHWVERRGKSAYEHAYLALSKGEIDALGVTENQLSHIQSDKGIKRVFENYKEAEASYFKKTGIFHIMHVMVIRKSLVEQYPDLPGKLFKLFCQSKEWAQEWLRLIPSHGIVWKNHYLEQEREIFRGDPWAYGLEKNRHVIEKFLSYCYGQGVSERELSPEDLFVPSTWDLTE
jgi:4,5-dihydroxyphthalate decarboxylase